METKLEEYEYGGYTIEIHIDPNPEDPRDFDNFGTMVCFHERYDLGDTDRFDEGRFDGWNDLWEYLREEENAVVMKPLYLMDHSGLRISTSPFRSTWDSGRVGIIYCTEDDIENRLFSDDELTRDEKISLAEERLESEVEVYDKVLSGQVYGFRVVDRHECPECGVEHGDVVDSCWGFFSKGEAKGVAEEWVDRPEDDDR